jgi:hypothetical protein
MVKTMKITLQKSNDKVNNINDGIEDDDVIDTPQLVVVSSLAVVATTTDKRAFGQLRHPSVVLFT